jgi:methyl-accepting chemotaxis protein
MKKIALLAVTVSTLFTVNSFAGDCSKAQAKESVEKMCGLIKAKGKGAMGEIAKYRYCGSNYVWVQDSDVKMVLHPIKRRLTGKDLKGNKDENGKALFVEFDKVAKANAAGGWVDYVWAKPGAEKATPKVSYVKKCEGGLNYIVGSGIWK